MASPNPTSLRKRRSEARHAAQTAGQKVARLFESGAALDSQTSESQWANGLDQLEDGSLQSAVQTQSSIEGFGDGGAVHPPAVHAEASSCSTTSAHVEVLLDLLEKARRDNERCKEALKSSRDEVDELNMRLDRMRTRLHEAVKDTDRCRAIAQKYSEDIVACRQDARISNDRCEQLEEILHHLGYDGSLPQYPESQLSPHLPSPPPLPDARESDEDDARADSDSETTHRRIPGYNCSQESQATALWRTITQGR